MRYVIGLDGGGSKTDCLIAEETGRIVGEGQGGPAMLLYAEEKEVAASLQNALRSALANAPPAASGQVAALAVAIPIAPWDWVEARIREVLVPERLLRFSEPQICRAASLHEGPLLLVVAGTGAFAYAYAGPGREAFAGGKGPLLGDQGSAYDLGLQALRAWVKAADGRGAATRLQALLEAHWEVRDIDALAQKVYGQRVGRHEIAALAPLVNQAAEEGDEVALEILRQGAAALVEAAEAVACRAGLEEPFLVAFFGSVLRGSRLLREEVERSLRERWPRARFLLPTLRPVHGAILLALRSLGVEPTREMMARLLEHPSAGP